MDRYPAVYYALALLSGALFFYGFWPAILFLLFANVWQKRIGFLLLFSFTYFEAFILSPKLPSEPKVGIGHFELEKIKKRENDFIYFGKVSLFLSESEEFIKIPTSFTKKELIKLPDFFIFEGKIKPNKKNSNLDISKIFDEKKWFFLTYYRFIAKENVRAFLKKHIDDETAFSFFASLATGEIESKILGLQFSKVGLSHTLAISGFHYTWLIFLLAFMLNKFMSKQKTYFFLLFFVSFYFLFIGETPSLNRAWVTALIFITGFLLKQYVSGLNSLGVALIASLILNPHSITEIGFQLSYLATFAILAIHPSLELLLRKIFPKRDPVRLPFVLSNFLRNSISITIAVHIATTPLLLYHFQYFPFISLFFNLFFPFAMSISMVGLLLSWIPIVGITILKLSSAYSKILLDMVYYGVDLLEFGIYAPYFSIDLISSILLLTIILGIYLEEKRYSLTGINTFM
jgi:competence protein ComEC